MARHSLSNQIPRLIDGVLSKWCTYHERFEPVSDFNIMRRAASGYQYQCREASKEWHRKDLKSDPYVYFILVDNRYLKIGMSTQAIHKVMSDYNSRNPHPVELLEQEYYGTRFEALDAETLWHSIFAHRHHDREWFNLEVTS